MKMQPCLRYRGYDGSRRSQLSSPSRNAQV
jgi:hypothetical protein